MALLTPQMAQAGTLTVGAGQTYTTLQAAVTAAASGDTILVNPGTYTITATVTVSKSLTIRGSGGVPVFQASAVEILRLTSGTSIVSGIKFLPVGERAIRVTGGNATLENLDIGGNTSGTNEFGAAVATEGTPTVTIRGSTFHDSNTRYAPVVPGRGGCVFVGGGVVRIADSTFRNCKSHDGGAVFVAAGNLTVDRTTFDSNVAGYQYEGGAIYTEEGTTAVIRGSTFTDNLAYGFGGAVSLGGGGTLSGNTFTGNASGSGIALTPPAGGAVYAVCILTTCPAVTLDENHFERNTSTGWGGAVYLDTPGVTRVVRNTFCANSSGQSGAGLGISSTVRNWTVLNNVFAAGVSAGSGGAIACSADPDGLGTGASGGKIVNNHVLGNTTGTVSGTGAAVDLTVCTTTVKNNLFLGNPGVSYAGTAGAFDYNLWFANAQNTSGRALGAHDLTQADPALLGWSDDGNCANDAYELSPSSPARNVGDPGILDRDGSRSDIGAFGGPDSVVVVDNDNDGVPAARDCDDNNANVFPGQTESCDGVDDDCDGVVDSPVPPLAPVWFRDADGDGHGNSTITVKACSKPAGYTTIGDDCADSKADVYPGSLEYCDGYDNDCDGLVDDDDPTDLPRWYTDRDGDGFGRPGGSPERACEGPPGTAPNDDDCDDGNEDIAPGKPESCDGVDEDCDGKIDNKPTRGVLFWRDGDKDGWGDAGAKPVEACHPPAGAVNRTGDCDDDDPDVHPFAPEPCDPGRDLNCDGASGQDDNDGDGAASCKDCDDFDSSAYPGAPDDWYDGVLLDCNRASDFDRDGDGYDAFEGGGYDCDDRDELVHPGAVDVADDGVDANCDGEDVAAGGSGPTGGGSDTDTDDEPKVSCDGCATGGSGAPWLALPLLLLLRRRYRPVA